MSDIETPRLRLRTVSRPALAATAAGDLESCAALLEAKLTSDWLEDDWVAALRLAQWQEDEAYGPWSIRAIILKETGAVIGNINCHDKPQPFTHDGQTETIIEAGYTIFTPWRRQGYGEETLRGLMGFAAAQGVTFLRLAISPGNAASLGLAAKLSAERIGSQRDEIDGPEDIYLVRLK